MKNAEQQLAVITHADNQSHDLDHVTIVKDHVTHPPLTKALFVALVACASMLLMSGAALVTLSIILHGLISFHGVVDRRSSPPLYWIGILPFLLGLVGVYALTRKDRRKLYTWGLCVLILLVFQTGIMGWAGNFTNGYYDAWPPSVLGETYSDPNSVCQHVPHRNMCYCNDAYHGFLSGVREPGVKYIYRTRNGTECRLPNLNHCEERWKETRYESCDMVLITSKIYYSMIGLWGLTMASAVIICILAHSATVCSYHDNDKFSRFENEAEDDLETSHVIDDDHAPSVGGNATLRFMEDHEAENPNGWSNREVALQIHHFPDNLNRDSDFQK